MPTRNAESDTRHHQDLLWLRERRYDAYNAFTLAVSALLNRDIFVRAKQSGEELSAEMVVDLNVAVSTISLVGPESVYESAFALYRVVIGRGTAPLDAASDDEYNAVVRDVRGKFTESAREALSE